MSAPEKLVATLSSKGQVVLPPGIRRRKGWDAGIRFEVLETPDGVLLKPEPQRQAKPASLGTPTRLDEVFGCAGYEGPTISLSDMDQAIEREVRNRHARGRY